MPKSGQALPSGSRELNDKVAVVRILFGSGSLGQEFVRYHDLRAQDDYLFMDNDMNLWGSSLVGLPILKPDPRRLRRADAVIITSMWVEEIYNQLMSMRVPKSKIFAISKKMFGAPLVFSQDVESMILTFLGCLFRRIESAGERVFLDFGTLLGLWRDGRLIPGDSDVDLSMLMNDRMAHSDVQGLLHGAAADAGVGIQVDGLPSATYSLLVLGQCVPISMERCLIQGRLLAYPDNSHFDGIPHELIFPLQSLPSKPDLKIPLQVERYLEARYGSGWRVPDPNWGYTYGLESIGIRTLASLGELDT